jgi:acyl-CoA thioester hydrolase
MESRIEMNEKTIYTDTVKPEWTDYNGHLRDAFYMLIYSLATDAFMDRIGLDDTARRARNRSIFTLEAHINFLHEIKEGAKARVDAWVLGADAKRIHLYMEMFDGDNPQPISACEQMLLHVDTTSSPKSAAFDPDVASRINAMQDPKQQPRYAGRVIALPSAVSDSGAVRPA